MSEVQFWTDFYAKQSAQVPSEPSSFATFVWDHICSDSDDSKRLLDLGCGTARDSKFFARQGLQVIGIDQASSTIERNNATKGPNETYVLGDVCDITECTDLDYVYSRFSIHSITKADASRLYQWVARNLKSGGRFFIEARSINDPLYKLGTPDPAGDPNASISGHYRRFIRLDELIQELETLGFTVVYQCEANNLSVCGNDNPVLVRVICELK